MCLKWNRLFIFWRVMCMNIFYRRDMEEKRIHMFEQKIELNEIENVRKQIIEFDKRVLEDVCKFKTLLKTKEIALKLHGNGYCFLKNKRSDCDSYLNKIVYN